MQVLEDRVPVRPGELVERVDRRMRIAGAGIGPGREQRRGQIGDRAADRLREILPRQRILLLLERAHAEHKPRDPVAAVDLHQPVGEAAGFVDIAFGQHREEGAAEQFRIARVGLQHVEVIGGRGRRIALGAGMPGGEIAARGGRMHEVLCRRCLRRERGLQPEQHGGAGNGGVPQRQRVDHDISIGESGSSTGDRNVGQTGNRPRSARGRENDPFAMPLQGRLRPQGRRNRGSYQCSSPPGRSASITYLDSSVRRRPRAAPS